MSIIRFDFEIILGIINATTPNSRHTARLRSPKLLRSVTSHTSILLSHLLQPEVYFYI